MQDGKVLEGQFALSLLDMEELPREVFVRQQEIPAGHYFPPHHHNWHQLLYALSGVLVVTVEGERYFVPPQQAIWLPIGAEHSVYSEYGADLKSLYIDAKFALPGVERSCVLQVTPLVRELIREAAGFEVEYPQQGYEQDLIQLLLQALCRLERESIHLPWPTEPDLVRLCNQLYEQPDDTAPTAELAQRLAISQRTLDRRFRKATGMSLKHWRLQLRMLKAVEMLNTSRSITNIALELGYGSLSAFTFMFRERMGISPAQYRKQLDPGLGDG